MICLSSTAGSPDGALRQLRRDAAHLDLFELRADFFAELQSEGSNQHRGEAGDGEVGADLAGAVNWGRRLSELAAEARSDWRALRPEAAALGIILTIRRAADGGRYQGDEGFRLLVLEKALRSGGFDYLDLEEDLLGRDAERSVVAAASSAGATIIRSYHAPDGISAELPHRAARAATRENEIPKLAVHADGSAAFLRIIEAGEALQRVRRIVIAMGPYGVAGRILAPRLGSFLTYCSSDDGRQAAPGHLTPEVLAGMYRYHELTERTAVFAVIGDPVLHSRSPEFHNPVFRSQKLDAVYLPLQLDDLSALPALADRLGLQGVSITIPHKSGVRRLLSNAEPAVEAIAACNTAIRGPEDAWYGYNTDLHGFLAPLAEFFGGAEGAQHAPAAQETRGPDLTGVRCTVIGAGGAARAVVYGLLLYGADVLILNRTVARAEALAAELGEQLETVPPRCAALEPAADALVREYRDLLVQTTSIGMEPEVEADPLPFYEFCGSEVAYDIVYTPPETTWLRRARRAGCRVIGGNAMFEGQARAQSALFLTRINELHQHGAGQ